MKTPELNQENLFSILEKRGLLDITKAYLKSSLYETLKSKTTNYSIGQNFNSTSLKNLPNNASNNALLKLSLSLIQDFLMKYNLSYTLSTFQNETKNLFGSHSAFTESELLTILHFPPSLFNEFKYETGDTFLGHVLKQSTTIIKEDNSMQTEMNLLNSPLSSPLYESKQTSIEEQLKSIDVKYNSMLNIETLIPNKLLEDKFIKFKRETEQRQKKELEEQMSRFKEVELSEMRIQERKSYEDKLEKIREEYEKEYREKYDNLKKMENESKLRYEQREKDLEVMMYNNRQQFQEQIEMLKVKEDEMNKKIENETSKLKLEQKKVEWKEKENEKIKESSLKKMNDQIEQYKMEYEKKFQNEREEFENEKLNLKMESVKQKDITNKLIMSERDRKEIQRKYENLQNETMFINRQNQTISEENQKLRNEIIEIRKELQKGESNYTKLQLEQSKLENQNILLKDSLQNNKIIFESSQARKQNIINKLNMKCQELSQSKQNLNINNSMSNNMNNSSIERENIRLKNELKNLNEKYSKLLNEIKKNNFAIQKRKNFDISINSYRGISKQYSPQSHQILNLNRLINETTARRIIDYPNRNEVIQKLEEEQIRLNAEIRNELRNITKNDIPVIVVSEEEIKEIKKNNFFNAVVLNEEKQRMIHHLFEEAGFNNNEMDVNRNQNDERKKDESFRNHPSFERSNINVSSSYNSNIKELKLDKNKGGTQMKIKQENSLEQKRMSPKNSKHSISKNISDKELKANSQNEEKITLFENKDNKKKSTSKTDAKLDSSSRLNKKPNTSINSSIKEDIQESLSHSKSLGKKGSENGSFRKSNKSNALPPISSQSKSLNKSSIKKFHNIDYELKENNNDIEEDYNDFENTIDLQDKNKQSFELEAFKKISNQSGRTKNNLSGNRSSNTSQLVDKFQSNTIEESIKEELSEEKTNKKDSNKDKDESSGSGQYNDFHTSEMLNKNKISSENFSKGNGGIEEDIQVEDIDIYNFD